MVQQITARDLAKHIANGKPVRLVDVRQPSEHELAALPGALLIPLNELSRRAGEIDCPVEALLVVYCHHGVRSLSAARHLESSGRSNVFSLQGGIDAWSREVDPTVPRY